MTELSSERIKHLEMTQAVVSRMAGESAGMKRFALVGTGIIVSASKALDAPSLALVGCAIAIVFWLLDARYLQQEQWYRAHFDEIRTGTGTTDFSLTPSEQAQKKHSLGLAFMGWSTGPLYLALVVVSLLMATAIPVTIAINQ